MGVNDSVRTFICIELPEEIRNRIDALQCRLKEVEAEVRWVRSGNIHLTLKFLGDIPSPKIASVRLAIESAIQDEREFSIEVSGTGCFPSSHDPKVLWAGVGSPSGALARLQALIEKSLEVTGFAKEPRPFSPHLTLGRVKSRRNARRLVEAMTGAGFAALSCGGSVHALGRHSASDRALNAG